jgi:photosystem II stability/assembly factor-like uncharacterized protein
MKNLTFCTFLIVFVMITSILGQWKILNEGKSIHTIDFVNDQVGWIGGTNKLLLKTRDAGETWISPESVIYSRKLDFIDENIGWIMQGYDDYQINKTTDGGRTWETKYNLIGHSWFNDFTAVDENVAIAVGRHTSWCGERCFLGLLLMTKDGGKSWEQQSFQVDDQTTELFSVYFINKDTGILFGDYGDHQGVVYRTYDGGTTWEQQKIVEFNRIDNLQFINDSTGYFLMSENEQSFLCETDDLLRTWSIKVQNITSFYFLDSKTVFAVSEDSISTYVIKSTDEGIHWDTLSSGLRGKIYFINNNVGFLLGGIRWTGDCIYRTSDGGKSWIMQKFRLPTSDVYFIDGNKGYICGGGMGGPHGMCGMSWGQILSTNNGGMTWKIDQIREEFPHKIVFIDDVIGFTLGRHCNGNNIYKTSDGGFNWTKVYGNIEDSTGCTFFATDMDFINKNTGFVVGTINCYVDSSGSIILGTFDGGDNWDRVWEHSHPGEYSFGFNSIYAVGTKAWVVGESGLIVKYTEQDQWQLQPSFTDLPLNKVFFSDENHGWIAGGYTDEDNRHLILLKTTNGGETWQEIQGFDHEISDMYFSNNLRGWAVGNGIMCTEDGGHSWISQVDGMELDAINFKNGYLWAVGGYGRVLKYDATTDIWIDEKNKKIYPTRFKLSQNYPNPFNPSTTIEFILPKSEFVELKVYNILGKEVSTLVSKQLNQGNHTYTFDGKNLASGIYYYQLVAGDFKQVKKMILLK